MRSFRVFLLSFLLLTNLNILATKAEEKTPYISYVPGEGIAVEALDATISPETTLVFQGVTDPNRENARASGGISWVGYLGIEKKFAEYGKVTLQFKSGWGETVEKEVNLLNGINFNSYDVGGNVRLRQYFYEQYLLDKQVTLLIGRRNPRNVLDEVRYAHNDDIQFLADIFNKSPGIDWPSDYTFTIHARVAPKAIDFFEFEFNFFEANADWKKIFKGGFYTWQLNFKPAGLLKLDKDKWEGNYRFYTWLNTRPHEKLGRELDPPSTDTKNVSYGFGLGIDQALGSVFGIFSRLGWQRPDVLPARGGASIEFNWSVGAQAKGKYWKRENDILAIAVGQVCPSKEYKEAGNLAHPEGHFESYYNYAITKYMEIGPSVQLIWNPDGVAKKSQGQINPVFIYGARIHILF